MLSNVWLHVGDDLVRADIVSGRGAGLQLEGVTIYEREGGDAAAGDRRRARRSRRPAAGGSRMCAVYDTGMNLVIASRR